MYRLSLVLESFGKEVGREHSNRVLAIALNALYRVDLSYLQEFPSASPRLYDSGVRYKREPPGVEDWRDIPAIVKARFGDCEDLACWRAAESTVLDRRPAVPSFRWRTVPERGLMLYHIVVEYENGEVEDPSAKLGMLDPRG